MSNPIVVMLENIIADLEKKLADTKEENEVLRHACDVNWWIGELDTKHPDKKALFVAMIDAMYKVRKAGAKQEPAQPRIGEAPKDFALAAMALYDALQTCAKLGYAVNATTDPAQRMDPAKVGAYLVGPLEAPQ